MVTDALFYLGMMGPPGGAGGGSGSGSGLYMIGPMVIIFALFYVMVILPQRRKEKERKTLIESTKTGDRVIFSGGIIGTVTNVKDHTFVVRVGDKVKMEILRAAVVRVLEKDEEITGQEDG
jgi:preprotein translocase subunit YajC